MRLPVKSVRRVQKGELVTDLLKNFASAFAGKNPSAAQDQGRYLCPKLWEIICSKGIDPDAELLGGREAT